MNLNHHLSLLKNYDDVVSYRICHDIRLIQYSSENIEYSSVR